MEYFRAAHGSALFSRAATVPDIILEVMAMDTLVVASSTHGVQSWKIAVLLVFRRDSSILLER